MSESSSASFHALALVTFGVFVVTQISREVRETGADLASGETELVILSLRYVVQVRGDEHLGTNFSTRAFCDFQETTKLRTRSSFKPFRNVRNDGQTGTSKLIY